MSTYDATVRLDRLHDLGSQWEAVAAQNILNASQRRVLLALSDGDANTRILACQLAGDLGSQDAAGRLLVLLKDSSINTCSGSFMCEEDEMVCVSCAAARALVRLGYATTVDGVYEKARKEGWLTSDFARPDEHGV